MAGTVDDGLVNAFKTKENQDLNQLNEELLNDVNTQNKLKWMNANRGKILAGDPCLSDNKIPAAATSASVGLSQEQTDSVISQYGIGSGVQARSLGKSYDILSGNTDEDVTSIILSMAEERYYNDFVKTMTLLKQKGLDDDAAWNEAHKVMEWPFEIQNNRSVIKEGSQYHPDNWNVDDPTLVPSMSEPGDPGFENDMTESYG